MHILENAKVDLPDEKNSSVCRVGWSVDGSSYQLGEDKLSWGYGGTGKSSIESKFRDYGKPFGAGDVITCYMDLDKVPKAIFFALNGEYLGVAFRFTNELGDKALFPHITVKNVKFKVNFGQEPPKYPLTNGFTMLANLPETQLIRPPLGPKNASEAEVIVMVGLPGSGKSYWCENFTRDNPEKKYYILGTNLIIDRMKITGLSRKRNYHGRWEELIKRASGILNKLFAVAKNNPRNYILDQTNVYFTARRRKMESFKLYKRKAVVIVNKPTILAQRIEKQQQLEGKVIPVNAIMEMKKNFTLPERGPSFDEVLYIEEQLPVAREIVQLYRKEGGDFKSTPAKPAPGDKRSSPLRRDQSNTPSQEKRPKLEPSSSSDRIPTRGAGSSDIKSLDRSHRDDSSRRRDEDRHHRDKRDDLSSQRAGRSPSTPDSRSDRFSKDNQRSNSKDTRDRDRPPRRDDRSDRSRTSRRDDPPRVDDHRRSSSGRPDHRDSPRERHSSNDRGTPNRSDRDRTDIKPPLKEPFAERRGTGKMSPPPNPSARSQDMRIGADFKNRALHDSRDPAPAIHPSRDAFDSRPVADRPRDPYHDSYPPRKDVLPVRNQPVDQFNRGYPPEGGSMDRRPVDYLPPSRDPLAQIPPAQDSLYDRRDDNRYRDEPLRYEQHQEPRVDTSVRTQDAYFERTPPQHQRTGDDLYRQPRNETPYNETDRYRDSRDSLPPRSSEPLPVKDEVPFRRDEIPGRREDFSARQPGREDFPLKKIGREEFPVKREDVGPRRDVFQERSEDFPTAREEFPPRRDDFQSRRDEVAIPRRIDEFPSRREDSQPPRRDDFPPRRGELPPSRDEFSPARRGEAPFARRDELPPRDNELTRRDEFPARGREEFPPRRDDYERENSAAPIYGDRYDNKQPATERRPYYEREDEYHRRSSSRDAYHERRDFQDARAPNRGEASFDRNERDYPPPRDAYRSPDERDRFKEPTSRGYPPQDISRDRPYGHDGFYDQPRESVEHASDDQPADDYNRMNRERSSYQTLMTTSTANYGHTTTSSNSFYRGTAPTSVAPSAHHHHHQRGEQRDPQQQYNRGDQQSPSRYRVGNDGAAGPPPPTHPSERPPSSSSYEKQQEDYQKAYSQWYANYASAFAALSQQDKK